MEPDILEMLYRKYYQSAYTYTLSLCKNKAIAEDIVSEAFVKAFVGVENDNKNFKIITAAEIRKRLSATVGFL